VPPAGNKSVSSSPTASPAESSAPATSSAAKPTISKPAAPSTSAAANLRRGSTPVDRARGDRKLVERPTPARSDGKKAVNAAPAPVKTGPGSLVVDSRPAGANVFVDGRLIGTTPLVMETMSVGDHAI